MTWLVFYAAIGGMLFGWELRDRWGNKGEDDWGALGVLFGAMAIGFLWPLVVISWMLQGSSDSAKDPKPATPTSGSGEA